MLFKQWYDRMCGIDDVSSMPLPKCFGHVYMGVCICTPITREFDSIKIVNTWKLEILLAEEQYDSTSWLHMKSCNMHLSLIPEVSVVIFSLLHFLTVKYSLIVKSFYIKKKPQEIKQKIPKQTSLSSHALFLKRKEVNKSTDNKPLFSSFTYTQIKISHSCHPYFLALVQQLFISCLYYCL